LTSATQPHAKATTRLLSIFSLKASAAKRELDVRREVAVGAPLRRGRLSFQNIRLNSGARRRIVGATGPRIVVGKQLGDTLTATSDRIAIQRGIASDRICSNS